MAAHTPAPWDEDVFRPIQLQTRFVSKTENGEENIRTDTIATVWDAGGKGEANARLITAAPELLSSLKDLVWELEAWDGLDPGTFEKAQAAIAKAEGR